jgi:hypothetical protein
VLSEVFPAPLTLALDRPAHSCCTTAFVSGLFAVSVVCVTTISAVLPATVFLGFAQVEGGASPLCAPGSSSIAVFDDERSLVEYAAARRTRIQIVSMSSSRLLGQAIELNPQ